MESLGAFEKTLNKVSLVDGLYIHVLKSIKME